MIIIERMVQKITAGKWEEVDEIDKRYNVVENRYGFPPKKRYRCVSGGGHDSNTLIIEREWASMAAMEAAFDRAFQDPEIIALGEEGLSLIESSQWELYTPLSD